VILGLFSVPKSRDFVIENAQPGSGIRGLGIAGLHCNRYLYVSELDGPEEVKVERDECEQEGGDDGEGARTSTNGAGAQRVTDDHVSLHRHTDDQPDRVVASLTSRTASAVKQLTFTQSQVPDGRPF